MFKIFKSRTVHPKLKKALSVTMCLVIGMCMMVPACFAADTVDLTPEQAATQIFQTCNDLFSIQTIVTVIGIALAAAIGIFLAWWAIRKVVRMVVKAFTKGKISV